MFITLLVFAIDSTLFEGGQATYILSGVMEKRQESEIKTIVSVFHLHLAGIVVFPAAPEISSLFVPLSPFKKKRFVNEHVLKSI